MKSRQVGYVLIALIAIGVVGLVLRIVSASSNELTLEGILPITPDVIDTVTITSASSEVELKKANGVWEVERDLVFQSKLSSLWDTVASIDGAQLVAINPANHARMGVEDGQGIEVAFKFGEFENERFIVGKWSPDVRLCYLRKPSRDEVYGVPCPFTNIFDPTADGWRNPIITNVPRDMIASIEYDYPGESFVLSPAERGWVINDGTGFEPANIFAVNAVLSNIEFLQSSAFAPENEVQGLDFNGPDAISIRIITLPDAQAPTTRVRLLRRDDISFYARTPTQATVFILDQRVVGTLLLTSNDFITPN